MSMESASGPPPVVRDQTIRVRVRPTFGGDAIRLHFSNLIGTDPLHVHAASIRRCPDDIEAGDAPEAVRFGGAEEVEIAPSATSTSDPIPLRAVAEHALDVSFHVASSPGPSTGHRSFGPAHGTTWLANSGAPAPSEPFPGSLFLVGLDVYAANDGAVVALGDSITEGAIADTAYNEVLARRLRRADTGPRLAVLNAGVGGDALRGVIRRRVRHDILDVAGVVGVILLIGTNDIGGGQRQLEPPAAADIVATLDELATEIRNAGLAVWISPVTPSGTPTRPAVFVPHYSEPRRIAIRRTVNAEIRNSNYYDPRIDFDRALRDGGDPDCIPIELSGDNLHPTGAGQARMGESIDLAVFDRWVHRPTTGRSPIAGP